MTIADIQNKFYFLTGTNSTQVTATNFLLLVNNAYERVVSLIMASDGRWEWDDANQTDLPISTTALVANQNDYSLTVTHLQLIQVQILDQNSIWRVLEPLDRTDYPDYALSERFKNSGIPEYYDPLGASIFLYPASNYSQAASLKVFFKRGPALFTSGEVTTGTKVPGFNSLYHDLIPLWAAYDYAVAKQLPSAAGFMQEIMRKEEALKQDFNFRQKDDVARITTKGINFR